MKKKGVTISDIAEKTGYSKTTVSFAFNWPNRISAETVKKIHQCAKELGYRSGTGSFNVDNRYKTICLVIPDNAKVGCCPEWARSSMRIYNMCAERGFMLSLIDEKRTSDLHFARTCAVDALMFFCPTNLDILFMDTIKKRNIPTIGIDLEPDCAPEEKEEKRIENAQFCANVLFDLIITRKVPLIDDSRAFSFFEPNL